MKGAIIGDIIGSRFEFNNTKTRDFKLFTKQNDFTDDTICTIAVMDSLIGNGDFKESMQRWCRKYPQPMGGYGASFAEWVFSDNPQPYNSFGNGAAMRVSPVAMACNDLGYAISKAIETANISHNHPEGIKGAIAVTHAVWEMRNFHSKTIGSVIEHIYYDPAMRYKVGVFDETCFGTVPVALRLIQASNDFEDAMRNTMEWGGDSDTLGAIVGPMAEACFGIPKEIEEEAMSYLPDEMKAVVTKFYKLYERKRIN